MDPLLRNLMKDPDTGVKYKLRYPDKWNEAYEKDFRNGLTRAMKHYVEEGVSFERFRKHLLTVSRLGISSFFIMKLFIDAVNSYNANNNIKTILEISTDYDYFIERYL